MSFFRVTYLRQMLPHMNLNWAERSGQVLFKRFFDIFAGIRAPTNHVETRERYLISKTFKCLLFYLSVSLSLSLTHTDTLSLFLSFYLRLMFLLKYYWCSLAGRINDQWYSQTFECSETIVLLQTQNSQEKKM